MLTVYFNQEILATQTKTVLTVFRVEQLMSCLHGTHSLNPLIKGCPRVNLWALTKQWETVTYHCTVLPRACVWKGYTQITSRHPLSQVIRLLFNGTRCAAVPSCQSQLQGELTHIMPPQASPFASGVRDQNQRITVGSYLQCSMHEVHFNTQVNFAFQCICIYKGIYINACLQRCIKGHLGTDTEYKLGVQQNRIRKSRKKRKIKILTKEIKNSNN